MLWDGSRNVSILGLMESVFRGIIHITAIITIRGFNPWFNGICIQGQKWHIMRDMAESFNPWFNGICIQGHRPLPIYQVLLYVSILGLMESVFRVVLALSNSGGGCGFNPWFNGICIQGWSPEIIHHSCLRVSILGLMESVFRDIRGSRNRNWLSGFNPWFNGICIQGRIPWVWLSFQAVFQSLV